MSNTLPPATVLGAFLLTLATIVLPAASPAATITIVDKDYMSQGLNDATPATPVGGNTGTTKGQQARIAFQHAADIWGALLHSDVTIEVATQFAALYCTSNSGVLGSAGPMTVHRDFAGAPKAGTWYTQAQANALAGADLAPNVADISMSFNGAIGSTGCLDSLHWYMGLDDNVPAGSFSLVTVAMHEIGHGLGMLSLASLSTGQLFYGQMDAFSSLVENHATGALYPAMTDAERIAASTATGNLHFTGGEVTAVASAKLVSGAAKGHAELYAPATASPGSSVSHWSTAASPNELMEPAYTGSIQDPGLALQALADIGWPLESQFTTTTTTSTTSTTMVAAGCAPHPVEGCAEAGSASVKVSEKNSGRETLKVQWGALDTAMEMSDFGDPVHERTVVSVCLYGDDGALVRDITIDRGGQACGSVPCWTSPTGTGYTYRDSAASVEGVASLSFLGGAAGTPRAALDAKNNRSKGYERMPTGLAAALSGQKHPTVQLVTDSGLCASATMGTVKQDNGLQYQARR